METDKRYFVEGLFIIGFALAAALFAIWISRAGHRDDVLYRMHFTESVSGLALGDAVKYRGVDIGTVKSMALDPQDPRRVQIDVRVRKDAPVKTDTKASLRLKGITGVVFVELNGGSPEAPTLASATPEDKVPEISTEKTSLNSVIDQLPMLVQKWGRLEDQLGRVLTDVGEIAERAKGSKLLPAPKDKDASPKR